MVGQLEPGSFEYREVFPAETALPVAHESTAPTTGLFESDSATRDYPAGFVVKMRGGSIIAHSVLSPDQRVIGDLSIEAGIRPEQVSGHSLLRSASVPSYQRLEGRSACIVNAYAGNYYHWILEVLPRYELLRRHAPQELADCQRIVFNQATHSYHEEVIDYLGLGEKVFESNDGSFVCEDMLVPALAGIMINPPPWACRYAREALSGIRERAEKIEFGPRIYISRSNAPRRKILNEKEILDVLLPLGFQIVRPEDLTVAQQALVFSQAQTVVSPHGAALTNTIFCSPGSHVVELFPPHAAPPCYWLTASHCGLEYRSLICDVVAEANPDVEIEHQDMLVDIEQLKLRLKSIGLL